MNWAYEYWIGWRYVRARRRAAGRNRFVSFFSGLSAAGIALGVAALIIVMSVMNGFQLKVRDAMLSVIPHVQVFSRGGALPDWQQTAGLIRQVPGVLGVAPQVLGQGMAMGDGVVKGVMMRGIDPELEPQVADIAQQMRRGKLTDLVPGEFGIVVGRTLALQLGLQVGDKLSVVVADGTLTPTGFVPRMKAFNIVGIYASGHHEYDSGMLLAHWKDAAVLYRTGGVSSLRVKTSDINQAPGFAEQISKRLPAGFSTQDWSGENPTWFAAVKMEKRMMFIILTLIVAVAVFNLVSMLVMTISEKQADIAILRTFGATPASIRKIFIVQGALIGWLGTLAGIVIGVIVALNIGSWMAAIEKLFGFEVLPQGIYLINRLPSEIIWSDVIIISLVSLVLSVLATIVPSASAARMSPVEALRHE